MTGPSSRAILRVEKATASEEITMRFSTKVFLPSTEKVDIMGGAVFATSKRSTRSGKFSAEGGVDGKVCVCETLGGEELKEALLYAKKGKALALIVTEEPNRTVDVPTILISRAQIHSIKDELEGALVSIAYTSGSYQTHPVTLVSTDFGMEEDTVEWDAKIHVPANTTDYCDVDRAFVSKAVIFGNEQGDIVEFLNKKTMVGRICLIGDCNSDRHFTQSVRLAAQYGAIALFTTYEKPPLRDLPLPIVVVKKKHFDRMKLGMMVHFKYKSQAKSEVSEPEPQVTSTPKSYASAVQGETSKTSNKYPPSPPKSAKKTFLGGLVGNVTAVVSNTVTSVGRSVGLVYDPQSKKKFKTIIAKGTSWSKDVHLYHEAMELLVFVDSMEELQDRHTELEALNEAIDEMINGNSGVGDVMMVNFFAKVYHLLSREASLQLMKNAVELIKNITIDERDSVSSYLNSDTSDLDRFVVDLVKYLSNQPLKKGSMKGFVINALWIRVHQCQAIKSGCWDQLQAITTRTFFKDEQETLLSFMTLSQFNTLAVQMATSFRDICAFFPGEDKVSVLSAAIDGLLRLYESDSTKQKDWKRVFGSIKDVTAITLLDRFEVENAGLDLSRETKFINAIVQNIEDKSTQALSDFGYVYDCLRVDSKLYDVATELMVKSICSSLESRSNVPSPRSLSGLLQIDIGRNLVSCRRGFNALKSYLEHRLFKLKRYLRQDEETLILLGEICGSFFACGACTDEEAATVILGAIYTFVKASRDLNELCLAAMDVSQQYQDIFYDGDNSSLTSRIGEIFIRDTGICSTIRASPNKLRIVISRLENRPDGRLSHFLYQHLVRGLKDECKGIDSAISFYESVWEGFISQSLDARNIVHEIIINSFDIWNPSSIIDLLKLEAPLLKAIHDVLLSISAEDNCEEVHKKKSSACLESLCYVAGMWREKFEKESCNVTDLHGARIYLTGDKQEVLSTILGSQFPSPSDIDEKFAEMENLIGKVRTSLSFSVMKDDDVFTLSINELATHYRIKIDTPLSHLISKYLSEGDPNVDLSSIRREAKYIFDFVNKNRRELQAAAHFHFFRSTLFQNEVGVWAEIYFDDFFSKISASLRHLELLLSSAATFSSVSEAASVLVRDRAGFDDEVTAIMSFHVVDDERTRTGLKDVMTLATLAEQLGNFVESCKTFKFAFAECDDSFTELEAICNEMNCNEGCDWNIDKCLQTGKRVVEILLPEPSVSADLCARLQYYKPLVDFFAELRHCSSVFDLAREKSWFGKKGLSTFYQEFENVTNVLNQQQSYEMEVLNRLEPTMQCISAVGGNLQCDSVATLLEILNGNDYFSHQNIAAMRMTQENICKIQDWLSEGMDDIAAIHSKFALIKSSGRIVISSEDSVDEAATPKRALSLCFSRSDASEVIMDESEVRELIQHLGFTTHESDESRLNVEKFVRVYEQCCQVMASQQMMADVDFGGDEATKRLEFFLNEDSEDLALCWLEEADKMIEECNSWLDEIRSKNRHSLLFWKDELRFIFLCMCDIRSKGGDEGSVEWKRLMSILSQVPLHPDCSNLIKDFASAPSRGSWLEDVSNFVSECGNQDRVISTLGGSNVIIHRVDCLDNSIFAAQLNLMHHIYKNRCPSSFEYLDASCIKSSDHVAMFLERVRAFPEHIFVIAHVERLAASEQELVATFISRHARSADTMHLHCIQSKDTVLYASPGVSISSWNDSSLLEYCPSQWLQGCVAAKGHVRDVAIVFSDTPGSGKTKFIRSELERANANGAQVASLYIHEDFSLTKVVDELRKKFGGGGSEAKSIHFALSCDVEPSDDFMLSVNHFFNSFLLFGNVYDPASGNSFCGSSHKWNVFVEMNAHVADEETAQSWLRERVPILSHCSLRILQPPSDFSIDKKARRVATYLRAYDNGTIDRKFNSTPASKTILFVLDKSGSMGVTDIGGRSRFQVAMESMLKVFNSHIRVMDSVGLILFSNDPREVVPLQRIEDEQHLIRIRRQMSCPDVEPCGGTNMYTSLRRGLDSVNNRTRGRDEDVWIVCLTDGDSHDGPNLIREQLRNSPDNLHMILIGANLDSSLHQDMRDLCNKYHAVQRPNNKGSFLPTALDINGIEGAFDEVASRIPVSQTFELDGAMSDDQCREWLDRYRPGFISPENKLVYSFWVSFIYRRVSVFDASEDFNYNETHESLGSSLMKVMLDESEQMLMRDQTGRSWSQSTHTQLIYDFSQPESPKFRLICTSPDDLDRTQREKFEQLDLPGFAIPNTIELRQRETLDRYLSQALSIPLTEDENGNKYLQCVNDHKFVLTLDFTLKLLNIHEHVSCGAPCVMEGETGVSKTALTKMYSILVNSHQMQIASASTMDTLESTLQDLMASFPQVALDNDECTLGRILTFLDISSQHTSADVYRAVTKISGKISVASSKRSALFRDMPSFVLPSGGDVDVLAQTKEMLSCFSQSHLEELFFDINIHASMTSEDINETLSEAKRVARKVACLGTKVVVFLDEINTASILGLVKEIIVDRSLNGEPLEENIVIVAACNPVRKSSLSQVAANRVSDLGREWVSGHYQVRPLPPSLSTICWDYGALKREQEKEFIQQRILMMDENLPISLTSKMTEILSSSHEFIRELARDHIVACSSSAGMDESEAFLRARSVVSLRDIQRVFHLTNYFLNHFSLEGPNSDNNATHPFRRAMLLSVAIVYYLRLDAVARKIFIQKVNNLPTEQDEECGLLDALDSAMDTVIEATEIPEGISLTLGLKENIFVTLVCTLSRVPLMIIGPPGCSKTLAVSIVNDNANGEESPSQYYRELARIQPFHYQCSKESTSTEIASVWSRAEQRQMSVDRAKQQCLVFMDEAGLPEEDRESLKVLHYFLEGHMSSCPNVAFVCITNHILDAAKSNRCACLLRPEPDMEELSCISQGVLCQKMQEDSNGVELVCFGEQVVEVKEFSDRMCSCYMDLMKNTERFSFFVDFFGLRDFIHFLKFLRRTAPPVKDSILHIAEEAFINALERNFNGIDKDKFGNICGFFLAKGLSCSDQIRPLLDKCIRDPMEVIHNALSEQPTNDISRYNLPRYKMIIDHTNDDSITRLLQISGILNSSHAFYKLSGIDEGAEVEKLNLVSRVKYAAQYGKKTVVLSQVEGVSECFYDLFNQHFKEFRKEDGDVSYFANIAIGGVSRPCLVSPSFQCIVHVQSAQLADLPAPFLNRFEKFQLNVDDLLNWKLKQLPPGLRDILSQSLQHAVDLIESIGAMSVWSRSAEDTLKSIYISLIRPEVCSDNDRIETETSGESIAYDILDFITSNFDVSVTVDDIHSCIESAKEEYRSFKEGVELERVIVCIKMGKATLPFEDVLNDCLHTPLSRVLKQIILSCITRCTVIRLLQLVRPDALYLRRRAVPDEMLRIYFGEQEHFSLKRLLGRLCEGQNTTNQFHIVFARSDSCAHSLPSWSKIDGIDPSILHRVRSLVHDDPSTVEIQHLDLLKSESEIRTTFNGWVSKELVNTFILVVDMKMQSANTVNFIRSYVEQATLSMDKHFLLLLHFPLSCDQSIYPALFLGKWSCTFLDGIGDADGNNVDFNNVLQSACSLTCHELNADTLLAALKPKALQYVASQVPFYSCSKQPDSVNQAMTLTARMDCLEKTLAIKVGQATLETILCRKFIVMWTNDRIREIVYRSAYALASGNSKLSFSSALTSTLQSSFNKFLAKSLFEINAWSNLDVLIPSSMDDETDKIFALVLDGLSLPGVPLEELLLIRDMSLRLQPLPMEMKSQEAFVVFPFFFQISSLIEMAIDNSNFDFLDQSSLDQNDDFSPLFVERVGTLLGEMADSMEIASVVRDIIVHVADSERLFSRYLQHILGWRYGCRNLDQVAKWVTLKMDAASMLDGSLHCNILYLHILCRKNVGSILRLASWDSECIAKELLQNGVHLEGTSFVSTVASHFLQLLSENFEMKEWSNSCSVFLQSLSTLMEGCVIEDEDLLVKLRLLIIVNNLIKGDVADEREVLRIVQSITEAGDDATKDITTVSGCLDLIQDFNGETTPEILKDAQNQLLRIFFSPWWLKVIPDKDYYDDAIFLVRAIKQRHDYINEQVAIGHLRNVLTSRRGHGSRSVLPSSNFLPSIVLLLSSELNATHNDSFSESGDRVGMPHFVPHWLLTEGLSTTPLTDGPIDEVGWYLRNYRNCFDDCPLAKIIFVIIFGELLEKARNINPNDLLIMFQASIQEQKEVSQATNARLLRSSGQASLQGPVSIKGCYVRALETDAILLTFICKVAEELSISSRSCALEGVNATNAVRILDGVMPQFRWSDLFFKVVMTLKGDGHLASLLSEGGPLYNFEWCQQWMQGLSSHQEDIQIRLRRAETALREAEVEEENKVRQFRRCPHCNEMFGVDRVNCGEFYCGRDAHGMNGPAIGGRTVQGGYGCGRQFRLGDALPYTRDEALLQPLREELRENRNLFEDCNRCAELWTRAERLIIPPVSFHLRNEEDSSMSSKIFKFSLADQLQRSNEIENIRSLADILDQLPRLEHVSCLPDLIEFYIFIHKTFRHVVTREESFNMKLQDVMDERLLRARFGSAHASHLHSLWLRVVDKVNLFASANESVTFECEIVALPFSDLMDVSLVQVLSEAEHPGNGHDSLFLVISDLLMRYNNFVISVSTFRDTRYVNNDQPEELHPRSLVRGSKSSIEVKAVTEDVAATVANLIESYWEDGSFELEGLLGAIQRELEIIGSLQTVMSPLRFLRERFVFRDCSVSQDVMEESGQCFFSSNQQLYFAQREDWMLYENARDKAVQQWSGGKDGSCGIRHKMIVTFQGFSHREWTSFLEGMRNTLDELDFSEAQEFGEAIKLLGIDSLQAIGFPEMDGTGAALVNTLNKDEIVEFIDVCGEQLASEAYTYNRLPSRLSEPISADSRECLESNIIQLLQSKSNNDVYNEIQAFCEDVLSHYEPHIVTVSEQSNEAVVTYLQRNNAWDNTDSICAALPSSLGIRNYIDIRKVFHQLKLRLRLTEDGDSKSDNEVPPDTDTPDSNAWKWVARPSRNAGAKEEIRKGRFDRLWFEEAIKPRDVDDSPNTTEKEANPTISGDNEDAATSDDGGVEEDADDLLPDLQEEEQQIESKPFEELEQEEEEDEVAAEVFDSIEANNIEDDDSDASNATLPEHNLAAENQTVSMIEPEAVEVPVEVKGKQRQMTAIAAVAFVMIFTALVYALYRYLASVNEDGVAEAESNEAWECKDDVMAELTAEEESNECIG